MKDNLQDHLWGSKVFSTNVIPTICFLAAAFLLGGSLADSVKENSLNELQQLAEIKEDDSATAASAQPGQALNQSSGQSLNQPQTWGLLFTENWGLGFGESGKCPTGNSSAEELAKYNAYYVADTEEKKLYLTFDCGYENGNTEAMLDALKKHNAKATFFVVGHYLETAPDIVKRMVSEGHTIGNHTYHHPDMSKISDAATFQKEVDDVRTCYKELIGEEMPMYYRPPQGKYSLSNLQMAKDLGYSTFFWSLAYVDWNVDNQPAKSEAMEKLTKRVHPGAVVLLHNTSKTNAEVLDELLTEWEEMGYTFGTLDELLSADESTPHNTPTTDVKKL